MSFVVHPMIYRSVEPKILKSMRHHLPAHPSLPLNRSNASSVRLFVVTTSDKLQTNDKHRSNRPRQTHSDCRAINEGPRTNDAQRETQTTQTATARVYAVVLSVTSYNKYNECEKGLLLPTNRDCAVFVVVGTPRITKNTSK